MNNLEFLVLKSGIFAQCPDKKSVFPVGRSIFCIWAFGGFFDALNKQATRVGGLWSSYFRSSSAAVISLMSVFSMAAVKAASSVTRRTM